VTAGSGAQPVQEPGRNWVGVRHSAIRKLTHQISFNPNWTWREVVEVEVITPAVGEIPEVAEEKTTALGVPKFARFRMLKNSARN
jgi:hypothetical protein